MGSRWANWLDTLSAESWWRFQVRIPEAWHCEAFEADDDPYDDTTIVVRNSSTSPPPPAPPPPPPPDPALVIRAYGITVGPEQGIKYLDRT
jgi:hypothetical protein